MPPTLSVGEGGNWTVLGGLEGPSNWMGPLIGMGPQLVPNQADF